MGSIFAVPPLSESLDEVWDTILDLASLLDDGTWVLVGDQAVLAHAVAERDAAGRLASTSGSLSRIVTVASALANVRSTFQDLGFDPDATIVPGDDTIGFVRESDGPDRFAQRWRAHVVGRTHLAGGDQALARRVPFQVTKGLRSPSVPVPDLLSTIVYEAHQFAPTAAGADARATDIAFLVSHLDDVAHQAERLTPSDGRALAVVDEAIGDPAHPVWATQPPERKAHAKWRILLHG